MTLSTITLAPTATIAPAATLAPLTWGTVSKKGTVMQHAAHSATAQALAPKVARVACAVTHDTMQLANGNYSAVREALALFKGKALQALQSDVIGALSQVQGDGTLLAPVIPWDSLRAKSHAVAVATAICNTSDLKGKKATMRDTLRAWLNMQEAGL